MFHSHFEGKNDKVLTSNIVHFRNFEINASLLSAPHCNIYRISGIYVYTAHVVYMKHMGKTTALSDWCKVTTFQWIQIFHYPCQFYSEVLFIFPKLCYCFHAPRDYVTVSYVIFVKVRISRNLCHYTGNKTSTNNTSLLILLIY